MQTSYKTQLYQAIVDHLVLRIVTGFTQDKHSIYDKTYLLFLGTHLKLHTTQLN